MSRVLQWVVAAALFSPDLLVPKIHLQPGVLPAKKEDMIHESHGSDLLTENLHFIITFYP